MLRKETYSKSEEAFPSCLRELLESRNVTQKTLADAVGVTRQAISNYMWGITSPDWKTIAAIAQFFHVSADYLLGLSGVATVDKDIQAICEYTGLSEDAVRILHEAAQNPPTGDLSKNSVQSFLDRFLNDEEGRALLRAYRSINEACISALHDIEEHYPDKVEFAEGEEKTDKIDYIRDYILDDNLRCLHVSLYDFHEKSIDFLDNVLGYKDIEKRLNNWSDELSKGGEDHGIDTEEND